MLKKRDGIKGLPYLLILPVAVIMGLLVFYPMIITFSYSLQKLKLTAPQDTEFIGLDNYIAILKSDEFWYRFL